MSSDCMIGLGRVRQAPVISYDATLVVYQVYLWGGRDHLIGSKCQLNSSEHLGRCYSEGRGGSSYIKIMIRFS